MTAEGEGGGRKESSSPPLPSLPHHYLHPSLPGRKCVIKCEWHTQENEEKKDDAVLPGATSQKNILVEYVSNTNTQMEPACSVYILEF